MATTIAYGILLSTVGGDTDLWGGYNNTSLTLIASELATKTANVNFADFILSRAVMKDTAYSIATVAISSNVLTLDLETADVFYVNLDQNITSIVINNFSPLNTARPIVVYLTQDSSGGKTVTFPSTFKFAGGVTPTVTTTISATDILTLIRRQASSNYAATLTQNFSGV